MTIGIAMSGTSGANGPGVNMRGGRGSGGTMNGGSIIMRRYGRTMATLAIIAEAGVRGRLFVAR